jgi:hypothetical protein
MLELVTRHRLTQLYLTPSILGTVLRGTTPEAFKAAFALVRYVA